MRRKIVYCTPSLYIPGGVERVLTTKANYFAEVLGYDIYIILTDGKDKTPYYTLSPQIHLINLDINFEELWHLSFIQKTVAYLSKQRIYQKRLKKTLLDIKPDITVSLLRREINFITSIKDGSKKLGELHVNKDNYRNFENDNTNWAKELFAKWWMNNLTKKLNKLDSFVVLTQEDKEKWTNIDNLIVIPNPLSYFPDKQSTLTEKQVIAVGRYVYQKGFDLLLEVWSLVVQQHPDWKLKIYGGGNRESYIKQAQELGIEKHCMLEPATSDITGKYCESSIFVLSSRFEGFGLVLVEAMSCGLPCVSFACPCGPKDIISENKDGFLVENGNIKVMASRLCQLIENEKLRKQMGEQALFKSRKFNINEIGKKWQTTFDEILKNK